MQTMHPVLKRGGLFSDWDLLPHELFRDRLARVQSAIAASGDDAWLIYGDAQQYGDVAWLSHFLPRLRSALVLVPRRGEPVVLAAIGSRDVPASRILTWVAELRPFTRLPGELAKLLGERNLGTACIGLVGMRGTMPIAEWLAIGAELPSVRWQQRDTEFAQLRASEAAPSARAIERSADVVATGLREATEALRSGSTVREATARIDRAMRRAAAEDVRILIATGSQSGIALRPADERVVAAGDVVLLFAAAEVQRHWAEGGQTFVVGMADAATGSLHARAAAALAAMRAAVRGGARAAAVADAAREALGEPLFAGALAYGLGNGIGLESESAPVIAPGSSDAIPIDGALALRVVLHDGGTGAIVAQTLALAGGKASPLIDAPPLLELAATVPEPQR